MCPWSCDGPEDTAGVVTDIVQRRRLPTFLAMAGRAGHRRKAEEGHQAGDKTYKVHIDGYSLLDFLTRKA